MPTRNVITEHFLQECWHHSGGKAAVADVWCDRVAASRFGRSVFRAYVRHAGRERALMQLACQKRQSIDIPPSSFLDCSRAIRPVAHAVARTGVSGWSMNPSAPKTYEAPVGTRFGARSAKIQLRAEGYFPPGLVRRFCLDVRHLERSLNGETSPSYEVHDLLAAEPTRDRTRHAGVSGGKLPLPRHQRRPTGENPAY